jgi:hypothetical protein
MSRGSPLRPWYVRPSIVLPGVAALMLLVAISTPEYVMGRDGDPRMSSVNRGPQGAKIFAEFAKALGWRVERRERSELSGDATTVHALLSPSVSVRKDEAHALLEAVRAGSGLLLVLDGLAQTISDSLKVATKAPGITASPDSIAVAGCPVRRPLLDESLWANQLPHLYGVRFTGPPPSDVVRLDRAVVPDSSTVHFAVGFPYGRGRVVVLSDPDMLRNDAIRICSFGLDVAAGSVLGYLAGADVGPARTTLVFDEYHQGYGARIGLLGGFTAVLLHTAGGRVVLVLGIAGLVFLIALMPRAVPPRDDSVVERRSPLEQVDALARAYAQVTGTRTATARLLRGVRRRTHRGAGPRRDPRSDHEFLARVATTIPARAADVAQVERALSATVTARELATVAQALQRIEESLTQS